MITRFCVWEAVLPLATPKLVKGYVRSNMLVALCTRQPYRCTVCGREVNITCNASHVQHGPCKYHPGVRICPGPTTEVSP